MGQVFKRKLTSDELNSLEWNIEGLCRNPETHVQLMEILMRPSDQPFISTPRRQNWLRAWRRIVMKRKKPDDTP
jgi:hypothetical protein